MEGLNEQIINLGNQVKKGKIKWKQCADLINKQFNTNFSAENIRCRYKYYISPEEAPKREEENIEKQVLETHNADGTIDITKEVWFDKNEEKTPENILKAFGYDPSEWEIISWTFGKWEVAIKDEEENRICTTIRAKIKPKVKDDITKEEALNVIREVLSKEIQPLNIKPQRNNYLDNNKLLELPGIELHLGKMAWGGDTGQDYDKNIAQQRFNYILEEIIQQQESEQCGNCLICIGNDFFNSDTINATTTKGTPQTNDLRWKKMFGIGLEMYIKLINTLQSKFNKIDIRLQSGNHDKMASFYLYIALSCYYKNCENINFSNDYKDVQCYTFGKCGIWFSHGDTNFKRLIKSIPAEFYEEWGKTIYRHLHLGHLHKEFVVDDDSGLTVWRVGSPTGTDQWHYEERFIGATQKYQTFVWDKDKGLQNVKYINFENNSKKKRVRCNNGE